MFFDSVKLLEKALVGFDRLNLPPIIVVANKKIGTGGISSYNHVDDVIYFNSFYHTQERIDHVIDEGTFAAQNLSGIIRHELGHKLHWNAIKSFIGPIKASIIILKKQSMTWMRQWRAM